MKYAVLIALRDFLESAKTKGFWIGLLVFPTLIGLSIGVSAYLAGSTSTRHFILVDQSGELAESVDRAVERAYQGQVLRALTEYARVNTHDAGQGHPDLSAIPADATQPDRSLEIERFIAAGGAAAFLERIRPALRDGAPEFETPRPRFVRIEPPQDVDASAGLDEMAAALRPYLTGNRLMHAEGRDIRPFAAILIGPRALDAVTRPGDLPAARGPGAAQYWSSNLTDNELPQLVSRALNEEVRRREYIDIGISPAVVERVGQTSLRMSSYDPSKEEGEETVSVADRIVQNAPIGFVYLLWISIFVVMQMLLGNTIEEKSNRIVEVLLSSVTPNELMMGKLIGIAAISLTMIGTWLATAFVAVRLYRGAGAEMIGQAVDALSASGLVPTFLFYFIFGYLLYAGIFLSIGSLCRSLKDAQTLQGPMTIIMMVPLLTMIFINQDPHGPLATFMTWIPIYTPFVMMNRAAADPSLADLIGTTLLMIATTVLVLWLSGRIFRIGILRVGQRARLSDVVQWIRGGADA